MTKKSAKIVFFGNERLATGVTTGNWTLKELLIAGYEVVAVVSHNESTNSRKQRELEIAKVAGDNNIPVLLPAKPLDIIDELRAFKADIGILVAYGKIVPQSVIDIFPCGIINIHPSALPKHRGPIPLEAVILAGERTTAISIMQLVKEMDAGPVYAQASISSFKITKQELADASLTVGGMLLVEKLPAILDGSLKPIAQDDAQATYDKLIEKKDGLIDWQKSAQDIDREIRAYAGWPKSQTTLGGVEVVITQASALDAIGAPGLITIKGGSILVACKWGTLKIEKLTPAGKSEMTAQAFLAGYGKLLDP
jgi:methionyl-tRNA formyltransferase